MVRKPLFVILWLLLVTPCYAIKIVVIGDSLTRQEYLMADSWPSVMQRSVPPGITIENLARDGNSFYRTINNVAYYDGKTVLQKAIAEQGDIYLVALGYNDLITVIDGRNLQQVLADYQQVMSSLKATGARVYFVGMVTDGSPPAFWNFWATIYGQSNIDGYIIVWYDKIMQMVGTSDNAIHPTRMGSAMQAAYVLIYMAPILGLPKPNFLQWETPEQAYLEFQTNSIWWQALKRNWNG